MTINRKEYQKEYHKKRYADPEKRKQRLEWEKEYSNKNRALYFEWKATLKCLICSENESCCLEFHHLDPAQKDFTIAKQCMKNLKRLQKEAEKCVVLCSNCHKKVHAGVVQLAEYWPSKPDVTGSSPVARSK